VRSAQVLSRATPAKNKKRVGRGNLWKRDRSGAISQKFESVTTCDSPAKNKNRSRPVFIFVVALSRVM